MPLGRRQLVKKTMVKLKIKILIILALTGSIFTAAAIYVPRLILNHYILKKLESSGLQDISYDHIAMTWQEFIVENFSFSVDNKRHLITIEEMRLAYSPFSLANWQLEQGQANGIHILFEPSATLIPPLDSICEISREVLPMVNKINKIKLTDVKLTIKNSAIPPLDLEVKDHQLNSLTLLISAGNNATEMSFKLEDARITWQIIAPQLTIDHANAVLSLKDINYKATQDGNGAPVRVNGTAIIQNLKIPHFGTLITPVTVKVDLETDHHQVTAKLAATAFKKTLITSTLAYQETIDKLTHTTVFNGVDVAKIIALDPELLDSNQILKDAFKDLMITGTTHYNNQQLLGKTLTLTTRLYGGTAVVSNIKSLSANLLRGFIFNVALTDIDLQKLTALAEMSNLDIVGKVSGNVTLKADDAGIEIQNALLKLATAGGHLSYKPQGPMDNLPSETKLALTALEDFNFNTLTVELKPSDAKSRDLQATVKIKGSNPKVLNSYPFEFNIQTTGKLLELLNNTLNSFSQPQNLRELNKRYGTK